MILLLRWSLSTLLILILSATGEARAAQANESAAPFNQGSGRLSILFGNGTAFDQNYSVIGLGAGYYVADGVEASLAFETWQGNSPHIERVTPGVNVVLYSFSGIKPYLGAFYRRTFIEDHGSRNEAGVRAGGIVLTGPRVYIGAGIVYDARLNCDRAIYSSCSDVYPELLIALLF